MPWVYQTVQRKDIDGVLRTQREKRWVSAAIPPKKRATGPSSSSVERARAEALAAKRAAELRDKARKRQAYVALQARQREAVKVLSQQSKAQALQAADDRDATTDRIRKMNETATAGELRRAEVLGEITRSGAYEQALAEVRKNQIESGGRYLDRTLYEQIYERYVARLDQVGNAYDAAEKRIGELIEANKIDEARAFYPEYLKALEEARTVFGDGRRPGEASRIQALISAISRSNDEYLTRTVLGLSAPGSAEASAAAERAMRETDTRRLRRRDGVIPGRGVVLEGQDEEYTHHKLSLADYMDELDHEYQRLMRNEREKYLVNSRLLSHEGFDPDTGEDLERRRVTDKARRLLKASGHDPEKVFRDLYYGYGVDKARAFDLIRKLMHEADLPILESFAPQFQGPWDPKRQAFESQKRKHFADVDAKLYQELLGSKAPDLLEGAMRDLGQLPVLGEVFKGASALSGGFFGLLRLTQAMSGGRLELPDLQLSELWEGRSPFRMGEGRTSSEEMENELNAWTDFYRQGQQAISEGDWIKVLEAVGAYGAEPFQGNIANFLSQAALDPLNFIGPGRIVGAGRRAILDAGGLPALLSRSGLGEAAGRFGNLVSDGRRLRSAEQLARLNKDLGTDFKRWADVNDTYAAVLENNLIKRPEKMTEASRGLASLWKVPEADTRALLTAVMNRADDVGQSLGLRVMNDRTVSAMLRRAEKARVRAEGTIRGQTARVTRASELARGQEAVSRISAALPSPAAVSPPPVVSPVRRANVSTARRAVDDVLAEYTKAVREVDLAAAALRDPSKSAKVRGEAFARLQRSLDELDDFEPGIDPLTNRRVAGRVSAATSALDRQLARAGLPTLGVAFQPARSLSPRAIAQDVAAVDSLIARARVDLASAATPAARAASRDELRLLGAARRHLERERLRVGGQQAVARETVRRYASRARSGVRESRVASRQPTAEAVGQEFARDLNTAYRNADVDSVSPLSAAEARELDRVRARLTAASPDLTHPDLAPFAAELRGASMWEALVVFEIVGGDLRFVRAMRELTRQADVLAGGVLARALRSARSEHYSSTFSLQLYRQMDLMVRSAFRARGRRTRKGALDFRSRDPLGGRQAVVGPSERSLADALDKVRVARNLGTSVFAYDEMRGILRRPELKRGTSLALQRKARARSAATGRTFEEEYATALAERVRYEATNDLERFAMQRQFEGKAPEEIWSTFVEHNLESDLVLSRPVINEWQRSQLRDILAAEAGVANPDDLGQMRRALGGVVDPPDGMRLASQADLDAGLVGLNFAGPVFIAPLDHPMLTQHGAYAIHVSEVDVASGRWAGVGVVVSEDNLASPAVVLHEVGHSMMHTEYGLRVNAAAVPLIRAEAMGLGLALNAVPGAARQVLAYIPASLEELMVELYGRWAAGARPLFHSSPGRMDILTTWDDIRRLSPPAAVPFLDALEVHFARLRLPVPEDYQVRAYNVPPFWDRPRLYEWLVDNGFWQRRTGERIRSGSRVWSVEDERAFFEARFGYTPPWTDPDVLRPLLDDPHKYDAAWEQWGVLDNGFEERALLADLDSAAQKDALAKGTQEAAGIRRRRTPEEQRRWMVERYGSLVADLSSGSPVLKAAPWLMDPTGAEYRGWVARFGRENIPAGLLSPEEGARLAEALAEVTSRRMKRYASQQGLGSGDVWLADEMLRFALDVTDELLYTKPWQSFWAERGKKALYALGQIQRLSIVFSIPFVIINLIERYAFRFPITAVRHPEAAGFRVTRRAVEAIPSLSRIGVNLRGLWEMRGSGGWKRAREFGLASPRGLRELASAMADLPFAASTLGEDAMKLHFARRVYDQVYNELRRDGASDLVASATALRESRRLSLLNWPSLQDASEIEKALNQVVPFLSYNFRTGMLFLDTAVNHPGVIVSMSRLASIVEKENREAWAEAHGDEVPFPDGSAHRLILRLEGFEYAIDLGQFSDVIRVGSRVSDAQRGPTSLLGWFNALVRVPHPQQQGLWALLTGEEGPWGKVEWTDFFWPAEFWGDIAAFQSGESDLVQFLSQTLTWQRWVRLDPVHQGMLYYFSLQRAGLYDQAEAFLAANSVVAAYLRMRPASATRIRADGSISLSWFAGKSGAEADQFREDLSGLRALQAGFDDKLSAFYDRPWDPPLSALKKARRAAVQAYLLDHPALFGAFAASMDWRDWQREMGEWLVDDLMDQFFALDRAWKPLRTAFPKGDAGELEYRIAYRAYLEQRVAWLEAHPLVESRLMTASTDLQRAWREQEASWAARLDFANDLRIRVLTENLKGDGKDRDLVDFLHDVSDGVWTALDFEAYASVYDEAFREFSAKGGGAALVSALRDRVKSLVELPGFGDYLYAREDASGKAAIVENEAKAAAAKAYADGLDAIWKQIGREGLTGPAAGKRFYDLLAERGLLDEYLARNPEKKAARELGEKYYSLISRWGRLMQAGRFDEADRYWKTLPQWVVDRYYAKHPEKRLKAQRTAAYLGAMERWVSLLKRKEYEAADAFFVRLPSWMKERYFAKHPQQRFRLGEESAMMGRVAAYFAADDAHKADMLSSDADLRAFLSKFTNGEDDRRNLILAAYRLITEPWLKRRFREQYPEVFSDEAVSAQVAARVQRKLRQHPELVEPWERAVAFLTDGFISQGRLPHTLPKPLEMERLQAHRRRRHNVRRRAARFGAHRQKHAELRHG